MNPSQPTQQHQITTTDGVQLYACAEGNPDGPALVMVHGYPDSHRIWARMVAHLREDFLIVRYDVRGAGQSDVARGLWAYRLEQLAQDLASVTQQVLGERPFHLLAHDWGSIQSWESVATPRLQGKILSYTTISGPCLDHVGMQMREQIAGDRSALLAQLQKSWYIGFFQLPMPNALKWRLLRGPGWAQRVQQLEPAAASHQDPDQDKNGTHGIRLYQMNFLPRLLQPQPRHAHCRVHAIVLENDPFVGPARLDSRPQWVSDLKVTRRPWQHWAIWSHAEEVAALVRADLLARA